MTAASPATSGVRPSRADVRFAPAKVIVADVEDGELDLDAVAAGYAAAWVVLRAGGCPQTLVEVELQAPDSRELLRRKQSELQVAASAALPAVPVVADADPPSISVVIPTVVGRADGLRSCLVALEQQGYDRFDIVLVDNRRVVPANDPLPHLVSGLSRVQVVRQPVPGISAARNAGVAQSASDIIVFTDDDVLPPPRWLAAIGTRFATSTADAVTGLVLPGELETSAQLMFERYYGGFSGARTFAPARYRRRGGGVAGLGRRTSPLIDVLDGTGHRIRTLTLYQAGAIGAGCNMAFRRSLLVSHPFDEALGTGTATRGGEDLAALIGVLWRGGEIAFEPAAAVQHFHRRDYDALVDQMSGYGTGFSAAFAGLIAADPRYLIAFARLVPSAARQFASVAAQRLRGRAVYETDNAGDLFPPELARQEITGYLRGPGAYLRSRRARRRVGR